MSFGFGKGVSQGDSAPVIGLKGSHFEVVRVRCALRILPEIVTVIKRRLSVRRDGRLLAAAVVITTLSLTFTRAPALGLHYRPVALDALREKADKALPREKCFLYARVISQMTDSADIQLNSGNSGEAVETLSAMRQYAEKIHVGVSADAKNLKSAELLIWHSSTRLKGMLQEASFEDRPALETTLHKIDQIQTQLMMQVFKK
jgi:hypothetical protein